MKRTSLKTIALMIGATTDSSSAATGVAVDSRLLRPGDLFFALPGEKVDGHAFIGAAAAAGSAGAVVCRGYEGPNFGVPLLKVDDVLAALQRMAKEMLKERKGSIIAVTGSLGKTTTKEFIHTLLKRKFKTSASPGNSNSQIGLPLAVINHTSEEDEVMILEMGMTKSGQISGLIEIAPPEVAVVTTVALVHAENFDSLQQIAEAKGEIFLHPKTKLGIYHLESDIGAVLTSSGSCPKKSFSTTSSQADISMQSHEPREAFGVRSSCCALVNKEFEDQCVLRKAQQELRTPNASRRLLKSETIVLSSLKVPGAHNWHNFLAAVTVARHFGLSWDEIKEAQAFLELPERRLQMVEKAGVLYVNDSYNASEPSMKAALDAFPKPDAGGRKIAFFGGIVELGKFSEECHRAVGKYALDKADKLFCFGLDCLPMVEEWKAAGRQVVWAEDRDELSIALKEELIPGM